jgi:hypothetical protein
MTGPLTSGNAGGGVFGLWQVGCTSQTCEAPCACPRGSELPPTQGMSAADDLHWRRAVAKSWRSRRVLFLHGEGACPGAGRIGEDAWAAVVSAGRVSGVKPSEVALTATPGTPCTQRLGSQSPLTEIHDHLVCRSFMVLQGTESETLFDIDGDRLVEVGRRQRSAGSVSGVAPR